MDCQPRPKKRSLTKWSRLTSSRYSPKVSVTLTDNEFELKFLDRWTNPNSSPHSSFRSHSHSSPHSHSHSSPHSHSSSHSHSHSLQTLDLKGREKFLNQTSVQSYAGCAHCAAIFPKGCGGPCFGISRRFLPRDHPLRAENFGSNKEYQYTAPEHLGIVTFECQYTNLINPIQPLTTIIVTCCRSTKKKGHGVRA